MRMPTRGGSATDVPTIPRAGERDVLDGRVRERARSGEVRANAGDVENAAAARHERVVASRGTGMEDECAERTCVFDPADRRAGVIRGGIVPRGDDDGHGGLVGELR